MARGAAGELWTNGIVNNVKTKETPYPLIRLRHQPDGSFTMQPTAPEIQDFFAPRTPDVWKNFLDNTGRTLIAGFARHALILKDLDLRTLLPAIRQPVLLMCGDYDRVVPPLFQEMLLAGLPNAGRVVIEHCGHMPSYTHPEIFAEVVRQFLTPPTPGAATTASEITCPK